MKQLAIKIRPVTEEAMCELERRGLVRRLLPTVSALQTEEGAVTVDRVYKTDSQFGSHMLICIGFNRSTARVGTHPDAEDFILINEGRAQKPLVLVVALHTQAELERRALSGELSSQDFWALEMAFNDPRLSFFTMNAFTPHCEWTEPGPDPACVFYVTEPSHLENRPVDLGDFVLNVSR